MSGPPTAAVPTNRPDPHQDRPAQDRPAGGTDASSYTWHLIGLVRRIIDYGKQLAGALQQRAPAANLDDVTRGFGAIDIALILANITRGLLRAAALEARLIDRAARQATARQPAEGPASANAPSPRRPRAAQPAALPADEADSRLAHLPTPAAIAADIRRRTVGAVLADICRDLGILPSHPLWRELSLAVIGNGGGLRTLYRDMVERIDESIDATLAMARATGRPPPGWPALPVGRAPSACPAPRPPSAAAFGTGPP
jgi:hypothetical protein